MIRFLTSGESHGEYLTAIIEGFPAGLKLNPDRINSMLHRRQQGYGASQRMKIELGEANIVSGIRFGETIGSPITIIIKNREWSTWSEVMHPWGEPVGKRIVTAPRPGHADLAGMIKYQRSDGRDVLERASARETAVRCAVGAICNELLIALDINIISHVVSIGEVVARNFPADYFELRRLAEMSPVRAADQEAGERMIKLIDLAKDRGETLGGIIEVLAIDCPVGLGSYVHWDRRLDARIAYAMMSIPAIKGVEIGLGFESTKQVGSKTLDAIRLRHPEIKFRHPEIKFRHPEIKFRHPEAEPRDLNARLLPPDGFAWGLKAFSARNDGPRHPERSEGSQREIAEPVLNEVKDPPPRNDKFIRTTNHAGGIEGGMSNGEPVIVRCAMKPLPTLMKPLSTIDTKTGEIRNAAIERSDVCGFGINRR